MTDILFSEEKLSEDGTDRQSVIVVGLPRSGSSLLSQVMSELPGWYVFDDLYTSRAAKKAGVFARPFDSQSLDALLHFLGWQIRARKRSGLYAIPAVEEDEIEPMNAALKAVFDGSGADWMDLQEEWLIRLAARQDCSNWGYKSPGAFRYLDKILTRHPKMKVVFLMRAPEGVLASYKHMPEDSQDGNPAQYHPITHAAYWRLAANSYQKALTTYGADRVMLVRFEDMISDPAATITGLAGFLDTPAPENPTLPPQKNTSFPAGGRRGLTGLESKLVTAIAGGARSKLAFAPVEPGPGFAGSDLIDFVATSGRALGYRLNQFVTGPLRRIVGRGAR